MSFRIQRPIPGRNTGTAGLLTVSGSYETIAAGETLAIKCQVQANGLYITRVNVAGSVGNFAISKTVITAPTAGTATSSFTVYFSENDVSKISSFPAILPLVFTVAGSDGGSVFSNTIAVSVIKLLDERVRPVITEVTFEDHSYLKNQTGTETSPETGDLVSVYGESALDYFGDLVQGYSDIRARIQFELDDMEPELHCTNARITLSGRTYTVTIADKSARGEVVIPIGEVNLSGELEWSARVKDEMSPYSDEFSGTLNILPYSPPELTAFSVQRANKTVDDEGNTVYILAPDGEHVVVSLKGNVVPVAGKNAWDVHLSYASGEIANIAQVANGTDGQTIAILNDGSILDVAISNDRNWSFTVTLSDWFTSILGTDVSLISTVYKAKVNVAWSARGFSVGMRSTGTAYEPKVEFAPTHKCYPYGGIAGVTDYVTGETPAYGTWIDGKPIYRYVLTADTTVDGGSTVLGMLPSVPDTFISMRGALRGDAGNWRPIPYAYYGSDAWAANFYVLANGEINMQLGSQYNGAKTAVLIFEYTRAQDTAPTYHSISANLTNVSMDDMRTEILSGAAYHAQLTAAEGYVLGGVTVTMGGMDVTEAVYGGGVISIGAVTGDIVITAAAVEQTEPELPVYTDQIPLSTDENGAIFNGTGWKAGYRINSSFTEVAATGMCCTGYIFVPAGAVVRIKNVTIPGTATSYVVEYDAGWANPVVHLVNEYFDTRDENGVYAAVINASLDRYIRLSFGMINDSSIVTVGEEISAGRETGRAVDASGVGYTAESRWSTSDGGIRSGATGITAINTVSFERAAGSTVRVELKGLNWSYDSNCTLAAFADGAFAFGAYLNTEKTDTVIGYNVLHGENGEVTLEFYDPGNSAAYAAVNGFRVSGKGAGSDAAITVYGEIPA